MSKKKPEQSVEEAAAVLDGLRADLSHARDVIKTADIRRRELAFSASQGDKRASAELEKVAAEESAATAALKNLSLAIEVANQRHEQAWARKRAAAAQRDQERLWP